MKVFYLYKTTCLATNKYYIGRHETDNPNNGYIGSGSQLKRSIAKHGLDQHKFEILEYVSDYQTLISREADVVNEQLLSDPLCMNLALGGGGDWTYINSSGVSKFKGKKHTDETKALIGSYHKGKSYNKGRVFTEEHRAKIGKQNAKSLAGKPKSEEHRQKLAAAAKAAWELRKR